MIAARKFDCLVLYLDHQMKNLLDRYFQSNKALWDKRTAIHKSSSFYDVEGFMKGKNVLNDIELKELGDVSGKSLLHLQCHFGLDSMSWSRLGAEVAAVDFSDEAIRTANEIKGELELDTSFICCNVYELKEHLDRQFDIVFTSYGVVGWLPDLQIWADIISHFLAPGGVFYMAEFHPVLWMFDETFSRISHPYLNRGVIEMDTEGTYTDRNAALRHKEYGWNHGISEVVNALIRHGMEIQFLNEHDHSPYDCFDNTTKNSDGNFFIKGYEQILPMVYSIMATKK